MDFQKLTEPLTVTEKTPETAEAFTFTLGIPKALESRFRYKAGQFVTLFLNINGQDFRRSYSLASSPDWDSDFKISVKRVKGGLVSNYLADQIDVGNRLNVTPPAGRFVLPSDLTNSDFVLFAAGSGITPILSIIKTILRTSSKSKVHLLYANRDESSIMFQRELNELNTCEHSRFSFQYVLSRPRKPWNGLTGRVDAAMVQKFLKQASAKSNTLLYMCGPEGFMTTVRATAELHGISRSSIHFESFRSPAPSEGDTTEGGNDYLESIGTDAVLIGDPKLASEPKTIIAQLNGESLTVTAQPGQSVLESLLEAGHNPPYSCMDGACMACLAKVKGGLVYQDDMGILTEDNTSVGECLTCQAKPGSEVVKIDYDL